MKVWANGRNVGADALSFVDRAVIAEELGFDSIGMSDHIVQPIDVRSEYPYAVDGQFPGDSTATWLDAIVSVAFALAATSRVEVATSVLVLPLREPLTLAKQVATIDALSGGRMALGIGAGWLREEFDALGVDFSTRGRRTDDYIAVLRAAWTGRLEGFAGGTYNLSTGVLFEPRPAHPVPILVGGSSDPALRRAGRSGDGWKGLFPDTPSLSTVRRCLAVMHAEAVRAGRDPARLRRVVSLGDVAPDDLIPTASAFAEIGVGEIAFRVNLDDRSGTAEIVSRMHDIEVSDEVVLEV